MYLRSEVLFEKNENILYLDNQFDILVAAYDYPVGSCIGSTPALGTLPEYRLLLVFTPAFLFCNLLLM